MSKEVNTMENSLGNKEVMARNIRHYMELNNVTRIELCSALGVKYTTFSDWINARTYPRIDKIELMARYFGITKADLFEDHTEKDALISYILSGVSQLNNDNRAKLLDYLKLLLQSQR